MDKAIVLEETLWAVYGLFNISSMKSAETN